MVLDRPKFDVQVYSQLATEPLFGDPGFLGSECRAGSVFPAVRPDRIDFWHGGGILFSYDAKGFRTHIKYASVLHHSSAYVRQHELQQIPSPIFHDEATYLRMKENVHRYAGIEAQGVSQLLGPLDDSDRPGVIAIDVEAGCPKLQLTSRRSNPDAAAVVAENERKWGRIDLVLLDCPNGYLRFYEVKHYSNPELWGSKRRVSDQLTRYANYVTKHQTKILRYYTAHLNALSGLLQRPIQCKPLTLDPKAPVALLVFGFDEIQRLATAANFKKSLSDDLAQRECPGGVGLAMYGGIGSLMKGKQSENNRRPDLAKLWKQTKPLPL